MSGRAKATGLLLPAALVASLMGQPLPHVTHPEHATDEVVVVWEKRDDPLYVQAAGVELAAIILLRTHEFLARFSDWFSNLNMNGLQDVFGMLDPDELQGTGLGEVGIEAASEARNRLAHLLNAHPNDAVDDELVGVSRASAEVQWMLHRLWQEDCARITAAEAVGYHLPPGHEALKTFVSTGVVSIPGDDISYEDVEDFAFEIDSEAACSQLTQEGKWEREERIEREARDWDS